MSNVMFGNVSEEAEKWISKALKVTSLPERKKILEQAREACPDQPAIDWELLFIGSPEYAPAKGYSDFSMIKSWLLQIYRIPEAFSEETADSMRRELFEGERLQAVLAASADPEETMRVYLDRMCREYIDVFLKEDNRLTATFFGIRFRRDNGRQLEDAVAGMLGRIDADDTLAPERRSMLKNALAGAL